MAKPLSETEPAAGAPVEGRDTHVVPEGAEPERLNHYAARVLARIASVSHAYKAVKRGELTLNGACVEPCRRVRAGDRLVLHAGGRRPPPIFPLELEVAYEDEQLAVVCKPAGIPSSGNRHRTLEHALPPNLRPCSAVDALPWPRPVHRLDARVGGLLLVAKTAQARVALGRQLEARTMRKRYRALLLGRLEGEGEVALPVGEKTALTRYRAVDWTRSLRSDWLTTTDLWPVTGRTHQLRQHALALGHPVLGDELYGIEGWILRRAGIFLWAVEVAFDHPLQEGGQPRRLRVSMDEPPKFESHRRREARRWRRHREVDGI